MRNDHPTGRQRYRTQSIRSGLFGRRTVLVLQVEVEWGDGPVDSYGLPEYLAGKGWRDAATTDLSTPHPFTLTP